MRTSNLNDWHDCEVLVSLQTPREKLKNMGKTPTPMWIHPWDARKTKFVNWSVKDPKCICFRFCWLLLTPVGNTNFDLLPRGPAWQHHVSFPCPPASPECPYGDGEWWPKVGYQWAYIMYKTCWILSEFLVNSCCFMMFLWFFPQYSTTHQPSIRILGGFITWKKTDVHVIVPGKGRSKTRSGIFSDSVVKALLLGAKGPMTLSSTMANYWFSHKDSLAATANETILDPVLAWSKLGKCKWNAKL